jgi:tRNA-splicing ligase RtcB
MALDSRLNRIDASRVHIENTYGINAVLFANEQVPVESAAVTELLEMLNLHKTVEQFAETLPR